MRNWTVGAGLGLLLGAMVAYAAAQAQRPPQQEPGTVAGRLLGPDGKPLAGARVYLVPTGRGSLSISYQWRDLETRDHARAVSDAAGFFEFPPPGKAYTLLVIEDVGAAAVRQAEFEKTHMLTLTGWGRIEGQAKVGTQPARDAQVSAGCQVLPAEPNDVDSDVFASAQVKVGESGGFVVEHVFPGQVSARLIFGVDPSGPQRSGPQVTVEVKAGETARVQLGGSGRPVVGKIGAATDERLKGAVPRLGILREDRPRPRSALAGVVPLEVMELPRAETQAWHKRFAESEEGKKLAAQARAAQAAEVDPPTSRRSSVVINADGSVRVDDVPPGKYRLRVVFFGPEAARPAPISGTPVGLAQQRVVVPEIPGGVSDEPVDAGELVPHYVGELKVGEAMPAVEVEMTDLAGKSVSLSDFRGKYLLLVEWGPFYREMLPPPAVGELWEKYKADGRVVLLGVTPARVVVNTRRYVEGRKIAWPTAVFNERDSSLESWFPITDSAAAWLIGPDGKIVAARLKGEEIKAAVEKVLAK